MLVRAVPAAAFDENCYVVATGVGQECVVVDPGIGVAAGLDKVLEAEQLRPVAVLLTHGHLDHCFSVAPVCGARGIPAYVHPGDRAMVADPALGLSVAMQQMLRGAGMSYAEPDDVAELPDGGTITLAGMEITVDLAPGHTQGSVLFRVATEGLDAPNVAPALREATEELCLSGDVLFAGSIGRTDLPGGSTEAMLRSLRDRILPLPDTTVVLPGHGPATSIGRERRTNPYLLEIIDALTGGLSG